MIDLRLRPLPDIPSLDNKVDENETKLLVPGFRQINSYSCGAVSAYSVVKTFHPKVSYEKVHSDCNPSVEEGAGVSQLMRALRRNGVGVSERWGLTFKSIAEAIERGFPIIAGERTKDPDSGHWVVIYGVGRNPNRVFTCGQPNVVALSGREAFTWPQWRSLWDERGLGFDMLGQIETSLTGKIETGKTFGQLAGGGPILHSQGISWICRRKVIFSALVA